MSKKGNFYSDGDKHYIEGYILKDCAIGGEKVNPTITSGENAPTASYKQPKGSIYICTKGTDLLWVNNGDEKTADWKKITIGASAG